MRKYQDWAPTGWDVRGLAAEGIGDFGVLLLQSRDSETLERSNFRCALTELDGESEDVQVHRFGHWACGWFEILLIRPGTAVWEKASKIEERLENYPVLDEEDWSELEWEENTAAGLICNEQGEWVEREGENEDS